LDADDRRELARKFRHVDARMRERLDGRHVRCIERRRHVERAYSASIWHALEHGGRYDEGTPLHFDQEGIESICA
jgi:hypothetical protein